MLIVPLLPIPSQTLTVSLGSQVCGINVYQKTTGVFMDFSLNDVIVVGGIVCHDRNLLVRDAYFGFSGNLAFVDTQGTDDPESSGLGSRWILEYFAPEELASSPVGPQYFVPAAPSATPPPTGAPVSSEIPPSAPTGLSVS